MIGLKNTVVELAKHNPLWKLEADEMLTKISAIIGNEVMDKAHIGSTSIPNIKAKPIIDLAIAVKDFKCVRDHLNQLELLGFKYYPHNDLPNSMYFNRRIEDGTVTTHHLFFFIYQSMDWKHHLYFRDYLRANDNIAKEYEVLKVSLLIKYPEDRVNYTALKAPFIKHAIRKAQVDHFLNKEVEIRIDRPIGTTHPKHPEIIYPINYGYIEREIAPDGEELDVYLLGVDEPLTHYKGTIIAIVHRENDVEDKLVMAPRNCFYSKEEIKRLIHFQEQFYISTIETI